MIDKRTEASVNYAEILARGISAPAQASEPAASAVSWNAPNMSMNMAAAMASLMVGSAAQEATTPALSSDAIRDAADFAENKSQLKNLLAEADRVVSGMQPGPEKAQAQGVMNAARGAGVTNIRAALDALKDMIDAAKSKEASAENILSARAAAEAEREAAIRQLNAKIDSAYDDFEKKGYATKQEREDNEKRQQELDQRQKEINYLVGLERRTPEQEARLALLQEKQDAGIEADKNIHLEQLQRYEAQAIERGDQETLRTIKPTREAVIERADLQLNSFNSKNAATLMTDGVSTNEQSSAVKPLPVISMQSREQATTNTQDIPEDAAQQASTIKTDAAIVFSGFGDMSVTAQNVPDVRGEQKVEEKEKLANGNSSIAEANTIVFSGFGDLSSAAAPAATPVTTKDDKQQSATTRIG